MPLRIISSPRFAFAERIYSVLCRCSAPLIHALPLLFVASPSFAFAVPVIALPLQILSFQRLAVAVLTMQWFAVALSRSAFLRLR